MNTTDTILLYGRRVLDYVSDRIIGFVTRGVSIKEVGLFSWTLMEIMIWNLAHFYLISFILDKWLHLDQRQTLVVMFLLLFWDTVGATLFLMYIIHQTFIHLFGYDLKLIFAGNGRTLDSSSSTTPTSTATTPRPVSTSRSATTSTSTVRKDKREMIDAMDKEGTEETDNPSSPKGTDDDDDDGEEEDHDNDEKEEEHGDDDGGDDSEDSWDKLEEHDDKQAASHSSEEETSNIQETRENPWASLPSSTSPSTTPTATATATVTAPKMKSSTKHPGLKGFHVWMDAITDLYRVFHIGKRDDDGDVYPNIPRSERGRAPIAMTVTNTMMIDINVFWIDFKGNEIKKGCIRPNGGHINITTWVGHPWIFRAKETGRMLLYYVPYRVIPVIGSQWNANDELDDGYDDDDYAVGKHQFTITSPKEDGDLCAVEDKILPFPAATRITSVDQALKFACQQLERENVLPKVLLKYLYNIMLEPHESKYRQIRVANKAFFNNVWCNGGRGVLEALGFEEMGAYAEMGPGEGYFLPQDRIKDLSSAIVKLEELVKSMEDVSKAKITQPQGADGSGRAQFRDMI